MATFSMSDALGSGFGLIARKPLTILVWGAAYLVLGVLPILAFMGGMIPMMVEIIQHPADFAPQPGGPAYPPAFMQMQARMMMLQPIVFLGSLVGRTVLTTAVFRAVLEPANGRYFFLRLGMQELWVGLTLLVISILAGIGVFVVVIPIAAVAAGVGFALYQSGQQGWVALDVVIAVVAALWIYIWLCVRFSLALPMSFAEREFRLFESWNLTKGHAAKLFGLAILVFVVLGVVMGVVYSILIAIGFAAVGGSYGFGREHIQSLLQQPPQDLLRMFAPWLALLVPIGAFLAAAASAIVTAPWAVAYREIVGFSPRAAPAEPLPQPPPAAPEPAPPAEASAPEPAPPPSDAPPDAGASGPAEPDPRDP